MTRENLSSYLKRQAVVCRDHCEIDKELYEKFGVKRGLRDKEGVGVLAGLTNISNIQSSKIVDGKKVPCEGQLFYRGYNIYDLVKGFLSQDRYGFEEVTYLLLFGILPDQQQLAEFREI